MSASTQTATNNGKKSSNSSTVNTPASTPITNISNGQVNSQSSPPPNNNAPKYGTLVPNRIFVGGISSNTTEGELLQLFSTYGTVKAAKIIQDRAGVSKGYGFITFESEDDAKRPLREAENIVLRERKLNIAPAIKKQVSPFTRAFDGSSPPSVPPGNPQFFFPTGAMPYFQGGVYYHQPATTAPGDPNSQQAPTVYQPPPVYPPQTGPPQTASYPSMMFPAQTIYMPQQYPMPIPYDYNYYQNNGASPHQFMHQHQQGGPGGAPPCPPMQPSNSPPRPACYGAAGQQIQGYGGPADPVFYNVSMYGAAAATMEGAPIYSEAAAFDIGPPPGSYGAEELYSEYEGPTSCDINLLASGDPSNVDPTHMLPHHLQHHPIDQMPEMPENKLPSAAQSLEPVSITPTSNTTAAPAITNINGPSPNLDNNTCEHGRNSATPVVSLLSIEQQQEKDILSMQGGRRRKSLPITQQVAQQPPHMFPPNGFYSPHHHHHHQHPPQHAYNPNGYAPPAATFIPAYNGSGTVFTADMYHRYGLKPMNGYDRSKKNNRRNDSNKYKSNEHSSRSSLRTDSNSSASAVDENKNEEKFRSGVNTPPPTAYSPIANQQQFFKSNVRSFSSYRGNPRGRNHHHYHNNNNNNNNNNNGHATYGRSHNQAGTHLPPQKGNANNSNNNNNNNVTTATITTATTTTTTSKNSSNSLLHNNVGSGNHPSNSSEQMVHGSSGGNFVPSSRRSRRSIRRNQGEMGQGDGPVKAGEEVTTVTKKMENLKL